MSITPVYLRSSTRSRWLWIGMCLLGGGALLTVSSCRTMGQYTHEGISYNIDVGHKWYRVEREGKTFSYDSPELTVTVSGNQLLVNSEPCGTVEKGDNVEITNLGTVLVNGQRRGDSYTGKKELDERLRVARAAMKSHEAAHEKVRTAGHETR